MPFLQLTESNAGRHWSAMMLFTCLLHCSSYPLYTKKASAELLKRPFEHLELLLFSDWDKLDQQLEIDLLDNISTLPNFQITVLFAKESPWITSETDHQIAETLGISLDQVRTGEIRALASSLQILKLSQIESVEAVIADGSGYLIEEDRSLNVSCKNRHQFFNAAVDLSKIDTSIKEVLEDRIANALERTERQFISMSLTSTSALFKNLGQSLNRYSNVINRAFVNPSIERITGEMSYVEILNMTSLPDTLKLEAAAAMPASMTLHFP